MVDAESADLVLINQYSTKYTNCLGLDCWENCFGRFDFSVSTFYCFKLTELLMEPQESSAIFEVRTESGSYNLSKH